MFGTSEDGDLVTYTKRKTYFVRRKQGHPLILSRKFRINNGEDPPERTTDGI